MRVSFFFAKSALNQHSSRQWWHQWLSMQPAALPRSEGWSWWQALQALHQAASPQVRATLRQRVKGAGRMSWNRVWKGQGKLKSCKRWEDWGKRKDKETEQRKAGKKESTQKRSWQVLISASYFLSKFCIFFKFLLIPYIQGNWSLKTKEAEM